MKKNSLKNYEVHQKLGSGSYGVIYKAINKTDRSVCVLKQINLARMNQKSKKNAINEATIMGKLKHPFIVCYIESFMEERNLNILMEYCDGGDLCGFLKLQNKKYLKEEKIWKLFIQICLGLEHIHRSKILHRDIKTLNIFLNKNQMVKIGDLGVAKMLAQNDFAQTMVGTPYYLSPELCQQKPYNQKSDIWALGCLLYELCTFKHPFQAANQASLILKIIRGKFSPIPDFYSKDLKDMIDWCLQRDYKRRPTANLILSKPIVKKYIEQLQLQKIITDFNEDLSRKKQQKKPEPNKVQKKQSAPTQQMKPAQSTRPTQEIRQNRQSRQIINEQKPKKFLDDAPKKVDIKTERAPVVILPKKSEPSEAKIVQPTPIVKRKSDKMMINEDDKPKLLFGNAMPESKADFINNLEAKMNKVKPPIYPKAQKKQSVYYDIPWKDKNQPSASKQRKNNESEKEKQRQVEMKRQIELQKKADILKYQNKDKIIIHNKILFEQQPDSKISQEIQRVRMEKKIQPKVYQQPKPKIKSGGFNKKEDVNESKQRIKSERQSKKISAEKVNDNLEKPAVSNSMRNIRKQAQQRPSNLNVRRNSNSGMPVHYPPRVKKPPGNIGASNPKIKPSISQTNSRVNKSSSGSRYQQVTRQEQQLVANLPDIVKKQTSSSDDEHSERFTHNRFRLNEIDNQMVLKKYEEIIQPHKTEADSNLAEYDDNQQDQQSRLQNQPTRKVISSKQSNEDQNSDGDTQQVQDEIQGDQDSLDNANDQVQENLQQSQNGQQCRQSQLYEINKFAIQKQEPENHNQEWQYQDQPELPMLEEYQTPYFQQQNPYLLEQKQKTQEEALEDKKKHLQMKLKQNMKREDEINQLMQMKIQQCRSVVPYGFQQILAFFRSKINMDRDYTDEDQKEVQAFLSNRKLTDQRKFQNIYKIMHFQMELQNTRRIIQGVCKKLNQLQSI